MNHQHGDTFDYVAVIPDTFTDGYFVGWVAASQVRRRPDGSLIADLDVTWADPLTTRTLTLRKIDTSLWPLGGAEFDVQFTRTSDGYCLSTSTVQFVVLNDVTRP